MIDWEAHYDALYDELGVPAIIETAGSAGLASVTVIDKVRGQVLADASLIELHGTQAACAVRKAELDDVGVDLTDLDGSTLSFNGRSWRVEAHRVTSPAGLLVGEVYLLLSETPGT